MPTTAVAQKTSEAGNRTGASRVTRFSCARVAGPRKTGLLLSFGLSYRAEMVSFYASQERSSLLQQSTSRA